MDGDFDNHSGKKSLFALLCFFLLAQEQQRRRRWWSGERKRPLRLRVEHQSADEPVHPTLLTPAPSAALGLSSVSLKLKKRTPANTAYMSQVNMQDDDEKFNKNIYLKLETHTGNCFLLSTHIQARCMKYVQRKPSTSTIITATTTY